ncbi:MAG: hypothetical protein QM820_62490 [Minicystis sp.]
MSVIIARRQIIKLLEGSLGAEKAEDAVVSACEATGNFSRELTQEQALDVLERIAKSPGLVGIAARFAKSRIHLQTA